MMRRQTTPRPAFTLVEMLVSSALILFIMAIISAAFRSGLDTFSKLNMVGRQQEQLENAKRIIQRDIGGEHFESAIDGFHGPRLSNQRLDRVGWSPPNDGYFIAWQEDVAPAERGGLGDGEGIASTKNTKCFLRFSLKLRTDAPPYDIPMYRFAQSATAPVQNRLGYPDTILDPIDSPSSTRQYFFTSTWVRAEYFMLPTGNTTESGVPLFSLRRSIGDYRNTPPEAWRANRTVPSSGGPPNPPTGSRVTRMWYPYPSSMGGPGAIPYGSPTGDDILLTDVVSCELKYLWTGPNPAEFNTGAKLSMHPLALQDPLLSQPMFPNSFVQNSQAVNDAADWPFSDLPLDSTRITVPGTGMRTRRNHEAWPGASGARQWDEDQPKPTSNPPAPSYYFDTWYKVSTTINPPDQPIPAFVGPAAEPVWANPPLDDRTIGPAVNPNARVPNEPPLRIRVKAIQFKLRIYDAKTAQTRQVTFMQEV